MIPAASLILIRDAGDTAPQILMVERSAAMAFAAGAFVFPGGRIDPADERLATELGTAEDAAKIAAIRECIEESGVGAGLHQTATFAQIRAMQIALLDGGDFATILNRHGLALDPDALTAFARWLPHHDVSRRFDTRFFIAEAPEGDWQPDPADGECVSARWVTAKAMLEEAERGEAKLIFPTRKILERLALHGSYSAIVADASRHPVVTITPVIDRGEGNAVIRIPEGLGYPVTCDLLEARRRE